MGPWIDRHKTKFPVYIPLGLVGWYFYGMFLNSLRLGTAATFHSDGGEIKSIWVLNPFRNWFVLLTHALWAGRDCGDRSAYLSHY